MDHRTADSKEELALTGVVGEEVKKPYLRPQLVRLGTWADMTRSIGSNGADDNGRFRGRNRTAR